MADQFTEQQVATFKDTFNLFDRNHTGAIEGKQLGTLLRTLGQNPTERELKDLRKDIFSDGGRIDFPEFLVLLARQMKNAGDEEDLREAFRIFDKKGNGHIALDDLQHIMMTIGEKMPHEEIIQMLNEIEENNEGEINYEELVTTMCSK